MIESLLLADFQNSNISSKILKVETCGLVILFFQPSHTIIFHEVTALQKLQKFEAEHFWKI